MRLQIIRRTLLIIVFGCTTKACTPRHAPTLALLDVMIVDVIQGSVSPGQTVLIAGDRIVAVGPVDEVTVPHGVEVIEASGDYLIPGLIDMHVHTLWDPSVPSTFLPLFVANGVTTVRDMGGRLELLREYRRSATDRSLPGPRVIAAGTILDGPEPVDPDASIPISTAEEGVAAVDSVAAAGADFVKVYTLLPAPAFTAVTAAAEERGLPVSGHVPVEVGPIAAAEAGMLTIEHVMSEVGGFCAKQRPAGCEEAVNAFRDNGTAHVPTLVMQGQTEAADLCGDGRLRFLPSAVLEYWFDGKRIPPDCDPGSPEPVHSVPELPEEAWLVGILHRAGIPLLAGSDAGVPYALPGWSLHDELQLLTEAGLSPSEVLSAGTWEAARVLGRGDELGTIRTGYLADLVLLSANPLEDIGNVRQIEGVVLNGIWFGRANIEAVLAEVAASVEEELSSRGMTGH